MESPSDSWLLLVQESLRLLSRVDVDEVNLRTINSDWYMKISLIGNVH